MNDELEFTVISDIHYYSKKNFVDGFDKNKKPKPGQLFFSRSGFFLHFLQRNRYKLCTASPSVPNAQA